jgi:hypothetical protein
MQQLDEHHKMLVREFIRMLSRISKKKWFSLETASKSSPNYGSTD